jgi:hypothetical protein
MPESGSRKPDNPVPHTRASSLEVPGAQQLLEANSAQSALQTAVSQDLQEGMTTASAPDNSLNGAGSVTQEGQPKDGVTAEDSVGEPGENAQVWMAEVKLTYKKNSISFQFQPVNRGGRKGSIHQISKVPSNQSINQSTELID